MLCGMRIAIGVLVVSVLAVASASAATVARPPSLILFNAPYETETAFGVIRPDGRGRRILSRRHTAQRWSPDGRRIVAYGYPNSLAVLDERGALVRALPTTDGVLGDPRWSPSGGRWLAGVIQRCQEPQQFCADLWIVRADGGGTRRLVSGGVLALGAGSLHDWAPDGRTLAYSGATTSALDGAPSDTGVVLVSMTGRKVLHPALRDGAEPTWSPDGRRLAFTRNGPGATMDVYVVGRDGRGLRRLTRSGRSFQSVWSPDGRRIAYLEAARGGYAIKVVTLGSEQVRRIGTVRAKVRLVWSPDGNRLAWSDHYAKLGTTYVFVARADGRGDPRPLTEGEDPDWR
jgi:Tol biopolymer transport system component